MSQRWEWRGTGNGTGIAKRGEKRAEQGGRIGGRGGGKNSGDWLVGLVCSAWSRRANCILLLRCAGCPTVRRQLFRPNPLALNLLISSKVGQTAPDNLGALIGPSGQPPFPPPPHPAELLFCGPCNPQVQTDPAEITFWPCSPPLPFTQVREPKSHLFPFFLASLLSHENGKEARQDAVSAVLLEGVAQFHPAKAHSLMRKREECPFVNGWNVLMFCVKIQSIVP